jgi:hypothetical protein
MIMFLGGCSDRLSLNPEFTINGTWITEFEVTHYNIITYPEDTDPSYTLTHTSTLRFDKGEFTVRVDPSVPPFYDMWVTDSVWEGQYFIEGDELTLAADCDYDITEVYTFEITGDTLRLSMKMENRVDKNGYAYVVMPIWGGLPWGRAMLCHGGSFTRDESK